MKFPAGIAFVHRESWAFLLACPLLALIPVAAEFAQHVVEMQAGMYAGREGAQAAEGDPLRLAFGYGKTLALALAGYWATRFYAGNRDAAAARRIEPRAVKFFLVIFALQALLSALSLFVFEGPIALGFFVFGLLFLPLLARFVAAAPLGVWIGPLASIRQMAPQLPWAIAFNIVAILPLMIAHYALGIGAIFMPGEIAKWIMLALDALVVGWLAVALVAVNWIIATRKDPPPALASSTPSGA